MPPNFDDFGGIRELAYQYAIYLHKPLHTEVQ
ncbi:hypothetical protein J2X77_001935 [Sphingobacterium sp. 2149]|nr:hypothetical protein [Sphingobacterium sp. 2149]